MADRVRISSKGQIVIPKKVRNELRIKQGDCLILEYNENEMEIILRKIKNFLEFKGILKLSALKDEKLSDFIEEEISKDIEDYKL